MNPNEFDAEFQRIVTAEFSRDFMELEECGHSAAFLRKIRFRDEWYCGHPSHKTGEHR